MSNNQLITVLQLLIYFTLAALVLTTIEKKNSYKFAVGNKVAIDKNWWFTITGISKRFLQDGKNGLLFKRETNNSHSTDGKSGQPTDLHTGEFCVDVSTYTDVQYDNDTVEVCDSTFAKQCTNKVEEVRINTLLHEIYF